MILDIVTKIVECTDYEGREYDVTVSLVYCSKDTLKGESGIHLINPSQWEIEQAIDHAISAGFDTIFIHQDREDTLVSFKDKGKAKLRLIKSARARRRSLNPYSVRCV